MQQAAIKSAGMRRFPGIFATLTFAGVLVLCFVLSGGLYASSAPKQSGRPRITGIDHVTIYVSDAQKSQRFYSEVLGLTPGCPQYHGPESCYRVGPSQQRILLQPVTPEIRADAHKSWLAEISFATDDVFGLREYLLSRGLQPGPIQEDTDGAHSFHLRDPEGKMVGFVHRATAEKGSAPSSKAISSRLIHAGFVVKDLAAENRFYVDLLGFRLYWQGGFKDDGTDWYELQVPDGPDWIEYMLNIPANADHKELGVQNHFSFGVKDVHAAAAELRARGYKTFDGPEVGRDGKDSLDAYDPDETRVEVMEPTPVQKPCCHPYTAEHPKL